MANVSRIPSNTEIIYAAGVFPDFSSEIYSSYGGRPQLAPHITIRGATWQGTTLRGPRAGNAFTIFREDLSNAEQDLEICGLVLDSWKTGNPANGGTGVFTVAGQVNGLRIVGNKVTNFGDTNSSLDHLIYLAEGPDYARAMRNLVIEWNDISSFNNIGALLIHSWNNLVGVAAHDVIVRYNKVRGTGRWGMILSPFWSGGTANWQVYQNDVRISAGVAVISFHANGGGSTTNGADPTFSISRNTLQNADAGSMNWPGVYGTVITRFNVTGAGSQHAPTLTSNLLYSTTGQAAVSGLTLDASNKVQAPGADPVIAAP